MCSRTMASRRARRSALGMSERYRAFSSRRESRGSDGIHFYCHVGVTEGDPELGFGGLALRARTLTFNGLAALDPS